MPPMSGWRMEIKLPAEGRGSWPGAVILFIGSLVLAWSATLPVATYRLTYYKTASSFDQPAGPTTLVSVERYLPSLDRAVLVISAAFIVVAVVLTVFLALPKAAVALGAAIVGVGAFIAARHPAM